MTKTLKSRNAQWQLYTSSVMSTLSAELSNFADLMTLNETSVERKISHIWKVLQETNNNLNACEQLLEHYSGRRQFSEHANLQDVSTQTAPYVESLIHMTTQTTSEQIESNIIRIQSSESKDSATQTNSELEVHSVGMQTPGCGCSVLNMDLEEQKCLFQHRGRSFRLLSNCESEELGANKTTQMTEWIGTKMLQGQQKIVDCFSSLEQHCQDMDIRFRSMMSLLAVLTSHMQAAVTQVFDQETSREQKNKGNGTRTEETLTTEKQHGQRGEEMQVLNTRLLQLVEMLAAERDNVVQLQKRRELLSAQIRDIKCSLTEAQVNEESLSYQTARLSQKNSRLRALLSHSRAQYCSQLAAARHMLHSRNAKVSQLRTALVKVRDLCHSIDSSYRTMLWEIGKQIQLTAQLFARNYGLELSEGPVVTTLTELNLREWYQHVWHTTKWIQLHILSYTHDAKPSSQAECTEMDRVSNILPHETCTSLCTVKAVTSSPHVAGHNSDLSFDLEVGFDMRNAVLPTAAQSADLASTTCSSLSEDLSWQHEASSPDRYQMQHRFLTILDNLKVKLLQLKPSSIQ